MRPSLAKQEADLAHMIADMPTAVTSGEQTNDCYQSRLKAEEMAAAAGELTGYRFSLHGILSEWDPLPQDGDLVTVAGVQHRILRSHQDAAGFRWDCGDRYAESQG